MNTKTKVLVAQFLAFVLVVVIAIVRLDKVTTNPYAGQVVPNIPDASLPSDYVTAMPNAEAPVTVGPPEVIGFIVACVAISLFGNFVDRRRVTVPKNRRPK